MTFPAPSPYHAQATDTLLFENVFIRKSPSFKIYVIISSKYRSQKLSFLNSVQSNFISLLSQSQKSIQLFELNFFDIFLVPFPLLLLFPACLRVSFQFPSQFWYISEFCLPPPFYSPLLGQSHPPQWQVYQDKDSSLDPFLKFWTYTNNFYCLSLCTMDISNEIYLVQLNIHQGPPTNVPCIGSTKRKGQHSCLEET